MEDSTILNNEIIDYVALGFDPLIVEQLTAPNNFKLEAPEPEAETEIETPTVQTDALQLQSQKENLRESTPPPTPPSNPSPVVIKRSLRIAIRSSRQPTEIKTTKPRQYRRRKRIKLESLEPEEERPVARHSDYNLRTRSSRRKNNIQTSFPPAEITAIQNILGFEDKFFSSVDIDLYHAHLPHRCDEILQLCSHNFRSQLDCFHLQKQILLVKTWISTVRIFRFNESQKNYLEVKRIPQRYMEMNHNLVTCTHYTDGNIYIGYLSTKVTHNHSKAAYLEIRNLRNELITTHYYEHIIRRIDSRNNYIFVLLDNNITYIHHKRFFKFRVQKVDLSWMLPQRLVNLDLKLIKENPTKLQIIASMSKSVITLTSNKLKLTINQSFNFDDPDYLTQSTHFLSPNLVVILRTLIKKESTKDRTRLIFGRIIGEFFIEEAILSLKSEIFQIEPYGQVIYAFGSISNKFEIGCIELKDLQPSYITPITKCDERTKFLVQETHIVIINNAKDNISIGMDLFKKPSASCIFEGATIYRNQALLDHVAK